MVIISILLVSILDIGWWWEFRQKSWATIKEESSHIAQENQNIKSVTLLPSTARGEYDNGGDVDGNCISILQPTLINNRERTISVELFFPDAAFPLSPCFLPNPYKDKAKDVQLVDWEYWSIGRNL